MNILRGLIISGLIFSCLAVSVTIAQTKPMERDLRWGYIKNFVHYIAWPKLEQSSAINICIVGQNPFSQVELGVNLSKKPDRVIIASHYEKIPNVDVMAQCQMVYFSQNVSLPQLSYIFNQLKGKSIVTIGDHGAFLKLGGLFQFVRKGKKLRFGINRTLLNKLDLKVSPSLLRLAL